MYILYLFVHNVSISLHFLRVEPLSIWSPFDLIATSVYDISTQYPSISLPMNTSPLFISIPIPPIFKARCLGSYSFGILSRLTDKRSILRWNRHPSCLIKIVVHVDCQWYHSDILEINEGDKLEMRTPGGMKKVVESNHVSHVVLHSPMWSFHRVGATIRASFSTRGRVRRNISSITRSDLNLFILKRAILFAKWTEDEWLKIEWRQDGREDEGTMVEEDDGCSPKIGKWTRNFTNPIVVVEPAVSRRNHQNEMSNLHNRSLHFQILQCTLL